MDGQADRRMDERKNRLTYGWKHGGMEKYQQPTHTYYQQPGKERNMQQNEAGKQ